MSTTKAKPKTDPPRHPDGGPDAATVAKLEGYGYLPDKVKGWSKARAMTVLYTTIREERIARNRAGVSGEAESEPDHPPLDILRLAAAEFIEEAKPRGSAELCMAVSYSIHNMRTDELVKLANHMVMKFREPQPKPTSATPS